jgi:predicted membrane channel-forming protein YqfA (hemolysin III family)
LYLVVIAWMYVVLMMAVAEAMSTTGSVLGAIVTFFLYGLLPVGILVYVMRAPQRRRAIKAREAAEAAASVEPDAGGQAPGAAEAHGVAAVRKEP